jgi:hypothetical protein
MLYHAAMNRIILPLIFALVGCTIIVDDDDDQWTGGEQLSTTLGPFEGGTDTDDHPLGEVVCRDGALNLTLALECVPDYLTWCTVGDDLDHALDGSVCCNDEEVGAICETVPPAFVLGGLLGRGDCPDGMVFICDYGE